MAEPVVSRKTMQMSRRRTDGDADQFYLKMVKTPTDPRQGPIALAMRKDSKSMLRSGSTSQLAPIQGDSKPSRAGSKSTPKPFAEFRAQRRTSEGAALADFLQAQVPESEKLPKKALQRRATMPTLDLCSEALLLSRQLHLDFHEVKTAVKEVREGQRMANGRMDHNAWRKCLTKVFGIELSPAFVHESYEQCKIADGEVDAKLFMLWYRDHIFNIEAHKIKASQGDELTMELAKKHHCSFTDLTKVKLKFDSFDLDKSGGIDFMEFEHMIHQLLHCSARSDLPKNRVLRFWHEIDRDNNGTVDFQEFTDWYMKYFATAKQDGPIEAFYASFLPDFQRSHTLEAMHENAPASRLDSKAKC